MKTQPDVAAVNLINGIRRDGGVTDTAAWNTLFDATLYLSDPDGYQRAYGTGTLADRHGE